MDATPQATANPLSRLHDIAGLDPVSWWPPAPGWYAVFVLLLAAGAAFLYVSQRSHTPTRRHKAQSFAAYAADSLRDIRSETKGKQKIEKLSALLREAAIEKHGRESCAGLEGTAWLSWLQQHDPENFPWEKAGAILTKAPYMPDEKLNRDDILPLIDKMVDALERWVT